MNEHFYLIGRNAEEPFGLSHLETLVHERSRVDGDLGSHVPCRMAERIGSSYLSQLLHGVMAERSARAGEQYLVYLVVVLAHQALEDGTVLAVDRQDGRMILLSQTAYQFASHDEGFLVGKTYLLAGLDGMDCRLKS